MTRAEKVIEYEFLKEKMEDDYFHDPDQEKADCTLQSIVDTLKEMRRIIMDASYEEEFFDRNS